MKRAVARVRLSDTKAHVPSATKVHPRCVKLINLVEPIKVMNPPHGLMRKH
jgi:hypothetical protein